MAEDKLREIGGRLGMGVAGGTGATAGREEGGSAREPRAGVASGRKAAGSGAKV